MCYSIVLSVDSDMNLSAYDDEFCYFSRDLPGLAEESFLAHPHKWVVESRNGCSCNFRHLSAESVALGFGEPVDWDPEEPGDILATKKFLSAIRSAAARGARMDCIDVWNDGKGASILEGTIIVRLSELRNSEFRFFENHRFVFKGHR